MVSHYAIDLRVTVIPRRAAMHQQRQGGGRLHANVLDSKYLERTWLCKSFMRNKITTELQMAAINLGKLTQKKKIYIYSLYIVMCQRH